MWKKIIFGLLGLIVVLILVGFLLPSKLEMSRSMRVNAPAEYSFEEVNTLTSWPKWSFWNSLDTTMKVTYSDKTSGAGSFYTWTSEDMGDGKLTITESVPFQTIKADLEFMSGGPAKAWYDFKPAGDSTEIVMGFSTDFGANPLGRWMGIMMKPEMNKAFDYNLQRLKELSESKPKFTVAISEENVAPISYIGLSHTMSPNDPLAVSTQMSKMYGEMMGALKKSKVQSSGYPFCFYPKFTDKEMDMVCSLPVPADAKLPARYKVQQTPGGRAIKAVHKGRYETLESTHNQVNTYIAFKNLQVSGAPWEVYVTDPEIEKDTALWITEVYYPVQ
jgi:effector-binding domain-containing protein